MEGGGHSLPVDIDTFGGIPFTPSSQWVVRQHLKRQPEDERDLGSSNERGASPQGSAATTHRDLSNITLTVNDLVTSCEFRHQHVRCCWSRTMLNARTEEAALGAQHQVNGLSETQVRERLLRFVQLVAATDPPRYRRAREECQRLSPPVPRGVSVVREIEFRHQPPPVLRADPLGHIVYRIRGTLVLRQDLCDTQNAPSNTLPLFLAIAADSCCREFVQPDPPTAFVPRRGDGVERGYPQLLLRQDVRRNGAVVEAHYAAFSWLLSPLGNLHISPSANPKRVRCASASKEKSHETDGAPDAVKPNEALSIRFLVYASVFASPQVEQDAARRVGGLDADAVYVGTARRYALRRRRDDEDDGTNEDRGARSRRLSSEEQRARRTEQKRIRTLIDLLDGVSSEGKQIETDHSARPLASLVCIGSLETTHSFPVEVCAIANEKTLGSVLPANTAWPLSTPPLTASPLDVDQHSTLEQLVAALQHQIQPLL